METIFGFLTGGPVGAAFGFVKSLVAPLSSIFKKIEDTKVALALSKDETERASLNARLGVLQARADLMVKESSVSKLNIYVRTSIGAEVSFLLGKILVWDKALGQWTHGHTDPLGPDLWHVVLVTLGFYFLYEGVNIFRK